ncbi:MAG: WYL domain-containing protein [Lachnospiraceae bacterium]|nr:WYL domain-containing protein [Lachnospiraceae bacterium]
MARGSSQKLKILYLLKILTDETDEQHVMGAAALLDRLLDYGIKAERKSIYDDIEQLRSFGYDIVFVKSRTKGGYYLGSREFELAELKLLVDAVAASKFMTVKKSRELIGKLEKFASKEEARQLRRQVYVAGRIKTEQENIYYNVDSIHRALQEQVQISFLYMEWGMDGSLHPKKGGTPYQISPWALLWSDENYYMIGFDNKAGIIKHYRVDKMQRIELMDEKRRGEEAFADFDLAAYANRTFGMYGGKVSEVNLKFQNGLAGVVMDRFGKDTRMRPVDEKHFCIRVVVAVSGQFFGWLAGLGTGVEVIGPEEVSQAYREHLQKILMAGEHGGK